MLWPKYLLGGMLIREGGGIGGEERGEQAEGLMGAGSDMAARMRGLVGRWPDADVVLQGGMSEGLRDWDLWCVMLLMPCHGSKADKLTIPFRGPLLFCLLLSLFLSWSAQPEQKQLVFSGVFTMVWVGEAVVTFQIKLLGGNMYVPTLSLYLCRSSQLLTYSQFILPIRIAHRLHPLPTGHRISLLRRETTLDRPDTSVHCPHALVARCRCQHPRWQWGVEEQGCFSSLPPSHLLYWLRHALLYQLRALLCLVFAICIYSC